MLQLATIINFVVWASPLLFPILDAHLKILLYRKFARIHCNMGFHSMTLSNQDILSTIYKLNIFRNHSIKCWCFQYICIRFCKFILEALLCNINRSFSGLESDLSLSMSILLGPLTSTKRSISHSDLLLLLCSSLL